MGAWVYELLNPDGRSWDVVALHQNLIKIEAISKIPLGSSEEDFWAWSAERHDMFTVKSAYRLLAEEDKSKRDHSENRASFSTDRNFPHWQKLWRCKVRSEVKVLWWRVSHDFMPSRDNLYRRHIDPLCTCDTCGARDETIFHGLTECTYAWGYWSKLKEFTGVKLPKLDLRSWTEQLLADQFCQERDRSIILCGMSVCGRFGEPGMIADMVIHQLR